MIIYRCTDYHLFSLQVQASSIGVIHSTSQLTNIKSIINEDPFHDYINASIFGGSPSPQKRNVMLLCFFVSFLAFLFLWIILLQSIRRFLWIVNIKIIKFVIG